MSDIEDTTEEVVVSSEMVLDDILGDDIIGESSDNDVKRKDKKRSFSESKAHTEGEARSRSNSYASDISSTASVPGKSKRSSKSLKWDRMGARYFVIKSNNMDNVEISMDKGVWATPRRNEDMLVEAFRHTKHVILIFSVRESGHFQGLARMMSMPKPNRGEVQWIVGHTPALRMLPNLFKVQWITKTPLDFISTSHLKNRWNEWKPVKISRDGQELEPKVGGQLCQMWNDCEDPNSIIPSSMEPDTKASTRSPTEHVAEENIVPSSVKTTYSSYKDENFTKSPERMSDEEEPLAGLSTRMKERLGGGSRREDEDRERERKRRRRDESRRGDAKPGISKYRMDLMKNGASAGGSGRAHERSDRAYRKDSRHHRRSPNRHDHRRRSPDKSAKDILLNGSYLDYVREYQSKHSRLAALLQDPALRQDIFRAAAVAATGSRSSTSSRRSRREEDHHLDERSHAALVDEFLSTHSRR